MVWENGPCFSVIASHSMACKAKFILQSTCLYWQVSKISLKLPNNFTCTQLCCHNILQEKLASKNEIWLEWLYGREEGRGHCKLPCANMILVT